MNVTNTYTVSQKYTHINTDEEKFDGQMEVEVFKKIEQQNPKYSIFKISYSWGNALREAISSSNSDLIKHIVKCCGKQIFSYHGMGGLVPLCYSKNAGITQLLIDLGADVNINFDKLNGTISPLQNALIYSKTDRDKRQIAKCLLKNKANPEKFNIRYKDIIENIQNEIKFEREFPLKGASLMLSLKLKDSTFSKMQIPSELIGLIFQKMIDSAYLNFEPQQKPFIQEKTHFFLNDFVKLDNFV